MIERAIFWHRRDLRLTDNSGLHAALINCSDVQPIFIFDTNILDKLNKNDQRVLFIYNEISQLKKHYQKHGADLKVFYGNPIELVPHIAKQEKATAVYSNRDYEPYAQKRDQELYKILAIEEIEFHGRKDHVIFEKHEIVKNDGLPYTVFTPYSRKWKEKLNEFHLQSYPVENHIDHLATVEPTPMISLTDMGFSEEREQFIPPKTWKTDLIAKYNEQRDLPALDATSRLSVHLRFGTISIRELAQMATETNQTYLNELIWRDFYQAIIYHFPYSFENSFKPKYDQIVWRNNEKEFDAWCAGKTGYPMVDAGMRELNQTGFMHNRVRMVVASFLTKHLLIDWRWGETYFAEKLLDFELASNVGGWQWASGSGCDAAPYFRVFNPSSQQEKFDPKFEYIKKWVTEFGTKDYPQPIVEHKMARERAIAHYKESLSKNS
jgi:deoxyribodipyrimidine photo-lyase